MVVEFTRELEKLGCLMRFLRRGVSNSLVHLSRLRPVLLCDLPRHVANQGFLLISGVFSNTPLSKHSLMTFLMVVCGRVRGSISSTSGLVVGPLSMSVASILTWMRRWSDT